MERWMRTTEPDEAWHSGTRQRTPPGLQLLRGSDGREDEGAFAVVLHAPAPASRHTSAWACVALSGDGDDRPIDRQADSMRAEPARNDAA